MYKADQLADKRKYELILVDFGKGDIVQNDADIGTVPSNDLLKRMNRYRL